MAPPSSRAITPFNQPRLPEQLRPSTSRAYQMMRTVHFFGRLLIFSFYHAYIQYRGREILGSISIIR
jgi:hypothetical protein